jgi:TonB family protein
MSSLLGAAPVVLDQKPEVRHSVVPAVRRELTKVNGEVVLLVNINAYGFVTKAEVKSATNAELVQPCLDAVRTWEYEPAKKDGVAVAATFIQPIRFGDSTVSTEAISTAKPRLRHSVDPTIPRELEYVSGQVTVLAHITAEGRVESASVQGATQDELGALCAKAVMEWRFWPAYKDGHPLAGSVYIPFVIVGKPIDPAMQARTVLVDNAQLIPVRQSAPELPAHLREASGDVEVLMTVGPTGHVIAAELKSASNPELGELSRKAVLGWRFKPVVRDGVAVSVNAVQPFKFGSRVIATERIDKLPAVKRFVKPELPVALRGVQGTARVLLVVGARGELISASVRSSSNSAFDAPVLEAVKSWTFQPAFKAGVAVQSSMLVPIVFSD